MATKFEAGTISKTRADGITTTRPIVTATRPRKDGKGSETSTVTTFNHGAEDKAEAYAAELKRESRGMKSGGAVKGWGKARGARAAKVY